MTPPIRRIAVIAVTAMTLLAGAVPIASAAPRTVDFCRARHDGSYRLQQLGERAAARVAERVGGGVVGDPVPGMTGWVFGEDCVPRSMVLAEASTVAPDGTVLMVARLEDVDGDGAPSAGDVVRTSRYPLDLDATSFGTFGSAAFTVAGGSVTTGPDGATEVRVWSGCGAVECWFFWATLDLGDRGYERYAEYRLDPAGFPTDNTGFFDGRDDTCVPDTCSGAFAFDVMSVRTTSPGQPADLVFDAAVSPTDDRFLDVVIGA